MFHIKETVTGGTSVKGARAWARRGIPGLGLGLARLGWFGVALVGIQSLLSIRFTWKGTAAQRPRQENMRFFLCRSTCHRPAEYYDK